MHNEIADDRADDGHELETVAGVAEGVKDFRRVRRRPDDRQVVTGLRLPVIEANHSAYVKLRRRGSIDFPIAGAAVALQLEGDVVRRCRIVSWASIVRRGPSSAEMRSGTTSQLAISVT